MSTNMDALVRWTLALDKDESRDVTSTCLEGWQLSSTDMARNMQPA